MDSKKLVPYFYWNGLLELSTDRSARNLILTFKNVFDNPYITSSNIESIKELYKESNHLLFMTYKFAVQDDLINQCLRVYNLGAEKYGNLSYLQQHAHVFVDAIGRHLLAYCLGHCMDLESGMPHLVHIMCNCLIIIEILTKDKNDVPEIKISKPDFDYSKCSLEDIKLSQENIEHHLQHQNIEEFFRQLRQSFAADITPTLKDIVTSHIDTMSFKDRKILQGCSCHLLLGLNSCMGYESTHQSGCYFCGEPEIER